MSNQSNGRKISQFLSQTSIPSDAEITYISSGVNYRITLADFLASIGVSGTIVQDGDPLGTPVLNTAGAVNNIRNVEDGSGIKSSVSAQNGITIEHNFQENAVGVEILDDITALSPTFASFVSGSGINVSKSGNEIQIAASGTPVSNKTVIVNDINDFPAAVSGVITLAGDTEYLLRNDISTANRFVVGDKTVINGGDSVLITLTYTGSGVMFTSTNAGWTLKNITASCSSGTFVAFTGLSTEILQLNSCVVTADTLGTVSGFAGAHFDDTQYQVTTDGFTFGGSNGVILIESTLGTIEAGTLYDLGSATFSGVSITDGFTTLNGSSIFVSGLASSGNINSSGLGTIHNCRFFGAGTPLQTITIFDDRWSFWINDVIPDSHEDCLVSLSNNATATVIPEVNTPTLVAGTWNVDHASHFTGDANGRCTYNGIKDIHVDISISFSSAPVSGSNKIIGHYAAINGSEIANSEGKNNLSAGDLSRTTILWRSVMSTGDYVEAFVENETDAVDILVTDAVLRVS